MSDRAEVLAKLATTEQLVRITRRKLAALALSNEGRIYTAELGGDIYASRLPRPPLAKLQEELARNKLAYERTSPSEDRDEEFAQHEMRIADRFRAIGERPTYPAGFI